MTDQISKEAAEATSILVQARKLHDQHLEQAREEAEAILKRANEEAELTLTAARDEAKTLHVEANAYVEEKMGSIETEVKELEAKIEQLRAFEGSYRTSIREFLTDTLNEFTDESVVPVQAVESDVLENETVESDAPAESAFAYSMDAETLDLTADPDPNAEEPVIVTELPEQLESEVEEQHEDEGETVENSEVEANEDDGIPRLNFNSGEPEEEPEEKDFTFFK